MDLPTPAEIVAAEAAKTWQIDYYRPGADTPHAGRTVTGLAYSLVANMAAEHREVTGDRYTITETTPDVPAEAASPGPQCPQHGSMTLRAESDPDAAPTWYCPEAVCHNVVLYPSDEAQPKGTIEITHTRADGTLLEGSRKGDGVYEIVSQHSFRYSRHVGIYIRNSRDQQADRWQIRRASEALRAAGWIVEVTIDEDTRRTFAEAEADRVERAEDRAYRFAEYADNAATESNQRHDEAHRISSSIPFGQPILMGHHSQRRAERDQERIDTNMRKGIEAGERASYWAGRANASEHYEAHRNNPARTLRRIGKLEADLRRVEKWLRGESAGGFERALTPDTVAELERQKTELEEQLAYWREIIAKAEADGFKVWGKADFAKGDFVLYGSRWFEVLRVNAKSVTIPHIHNGIGRTVVRKSEGHIDWTWTAPYTDVSGRRSAEEMAAESTQE